MSEENITRLSIDGKEIIIIGTAHVSEESAKEVKEVIEREQPDSVCVELDEQRYQSIIANDQWKQMDVFKIVKERKATFLLMNLFISSFQRRLAKQFGIRPGQEMIQGIESAKEINANLVLADRNIQITFSRVWHNIGFMGKLNLIMQIMYSVISQDTISKEELEKLKTQDMLNSMLEEFTKAFPDLKVPLIDERDQYLAQKIKDAPGEKIVAVVGAAHVPGIKEEINQDHDLEAISKIPPKSKLPKIIAWAIPIIILSIIGYTFFANPTAGMQQTLSWVLWNGSLSAIGATLALGHPMAILTAFLVAPFSSLNPLIAAGIFTGIVQAYFRRPTVQDFETFSDDILSVKGFWRNKVTRILLIVVFTNIGSALGTFIGGADVLRIFNENIFK